LTNNFLWFIAALFLVLCSIPLFLDLGKSPIYMWDEATYANNSIDMYKSHDPIVVRMEGIPDLYNTKPPLVIWCQALSMKIFGINEFAVRLPSAIFAFCAMVVLLWFSITVLNSFIIGVIAMVTLACSNGFISNHGARSGDLDASLVFWMAFYVFVFLKWLIEQRRNNLHLIVVALGLTGAFLSKGIAGFFFVPFLLLIAIVSGQFRQLIRQKEIYFSAIAVLALCSGYYLLREMSAPGYLKILYDSELSRYGKTVMSWHVKPFGFYLNNFYEGRFTPFLFMAKNNRIKRVVAYLLILATGYFLLISFPADKLEWYDEPLFPVLSMLVGISIGEILNVTLTFKRKEISIILYSIGILVIAFIYFLSFKKIFNKVSADDHIRYDWDSTQIDLFRINGAYVKYLHGHLPEIKKYSVYKSYPNDPEHEDQLKFYIRSYEICDGIRIDIKHSKSKIMPSEIIMVTEKYQRDSLLNDFDVTVLDQWNGCELLQLNNFKQDPETHQVL
jgi:4-amino-4-deoxy-L-arabinose transferase-like glycosyltransferase